MGILYYALTNGINFESDIRFAEDHRVVQVKTFRILLNAEGTSFCGIQIDKVMEKSRNTSTLILLNWFFCILINTRLE